MQNGKMVVTVVCCTDRCVHEDCLDHLMQGGKMVVTVVCCTDSVFMRIVWIT